MWGQFGSSMVQKDVRKKFLSAGYFDGPLSGLLGHFVWCHHPTFHRGPERDSGSLKML